MKLKADKHYSYGITTATMGSQQQLWDHNSSYGITIAAASVVETLTGREQRSISGYWKCSIIHQQQFFK
jgi:hypothetical protein